jgi:two-component system sensor histidine kinase YesM
MKARKGSFRRQLFLGTLVVSLLPLLLCSTIMVFVFSATTQQKNHDSGVELGQELTVQMTQALETQKQALLTLAAAPEIQIYGFHMSDSAAQTVYLALYRAANETLGNATFSLYDATGKLCYTTGESGVDAALPTYWGILRRASQQDSPYFAAQTVSDLTNRQSVCLKGAYILRDGKGNRKGYIVCSMSLQQMSNLMSGQLSAGAELYIVNRQWRLVYSSRAREDGSRIEEMRKELYGGTPYSDDKNCFVAQEPVTGLMLVLDYPAAVSTDAWNVMRIVSLFFGAVSLILCIFVSRWIANGQFRPIGQLSGAMGRVRKGDLSVRIPVERQDEFGSLAETFNAMTERLAEHVQEQVQHQRDLNDAQIRQMQAQLNPHFLYNTLDTMKWLAKIHQMPEVASLAGNLGAILRASISSEQFVTLQKEAALVDQYVEIQKIRFSGRFRYVVDLPESMQECIVPKLVLQPLVENAILHGLDGCTSGCIYLYGWEREGELHVFVTDDGCGMPPEIMDRINAPQPKLLEGHLGLYNVATILKLHYGEKYGLHASSIEGVGTTVSLVIPAQREEDAHA